MLRWWTAEALLRLAVTPMLLATLGARDFVYAAVVGVVLGWAALWRRPLSGALIVATAALMAGLAVAPTGSTLGGAWPVFALLKVGQALAVGATAGHADRASDARWRVAAVLGMILAAIADAGLVGLGLAGLTLSVLRWLVLGRPSPLPPAGPVAMSSRLTYRTGVLVVTAWTASSDPVAAAMWAVLSAVCFRLVQAAAGTSAWLHPSRREQARATRTDLPARRFARALDGTLLVSGGLAVMLGIHGPGLWHLWLGAWHSRLAALSPSAVSGLLWPLLAALVPLAAVAFVSGQWLVDHGERPRVAAVTGEEAAVATVASIILGALGPSGVAAAVALCVALISGRRLTERAVAGLGAGAGLLRRRLAVFGLALLPTVIVAVCLARLRTPRNGAEIAVGAIITAVVHVASAGSWWIIGSRRGL